jgi:hypothetical protein
MTMNDQISYPVLAFLVLVTATLAIAIASVLRRLGVMAPIPLKYLPHLVLLLTIAVTPMVAAGLPTLQKSLIVLGGVIAIWLVAVGLSSRAETWISRKSPNTR